MGKIFSSSFRAFPAFQLLVCISLTQSVFAAENPNNAIVSVLDEDRRSEKSSASPYKVTVNTDLVMTDVAVKGNNLPQLKAEDFIIYDNKVAQKTAFFSYDRMPIEVAILVDESCSVKPIFPYLQVSSLLSLKSLKAEDRVALFKFGNSCKRVAELTGDRLFIAGKIAEIEPDGGTRVFHALKETGNYLHKKAAAKRRAIILISDNCEVKMSGNGKFGIVEEARVKEATYAVLESSAALYSIRFGNAYDKGSVCDYSDVYVRSIVEKSGGEYFVVKQETSLQSALKEVMTNLRYRYTLGFYPSNPGKDGSYHELDIQLRDRERLSPHKVTARKGYYAGISISSQEKTVDPPKVQASAENTDSRLVRRAIEVAGDFHVNIPDIEITATAGKTVELNGRPKMEISIEIDSGDLGFEMSDGQYTGAQDIAIFCFDDKWKILGTEWKRIEHRLNPEQFRQIKSIVQYNTAITAYETMRALNIVVYDELRNQIGSKIVYLPGAPETYSDSLFPN